MTHSESIGERVARYRKERGISAQALADRSGLTRAIITNIESGRRSDPTVSQLIAIALVLGVSPADLVFDLADPYREVELMPGATTAEWLARDWFGGYLLARETLPENPESFESPPSVYARWGTPHQLRERARTMKALEIHEQRVAILRKPDPTADELAVSASLGNDIGQLQAKITTFRAELYELEKLLRAAGVNLDRPVVYPGSPF